MSAQNAECVSAAEPERHTLRKHLREHGKATPAHVWASRCRWCILGSRWWEWRHKPEQAARNEPTLACGHPGLPTDNYCGYCGRKSAGEDLGDRCVGEAIDLLRTVPPDMELLHGEEYAKAEAWWDRQAALLAQIGGGDAFEERPLPAGLHELRLPGPFWQEALAALRRRRARR